MWQSSCNQLQGQLSSFLLLREKKHSLFGLGGLSLSPCFCWGQDPTLLLSLRKFAD